MSTAEEKTVANTPPTSLTLREEVPSYMQNETELGNELVSQYVIPPRLKVVQPLSREPFKSMFNPGDVVLVPQIVLVAPVKLGENQRPSTTGTRFFFTPLLFYVEWCLWSDIKARGAKPAVLERSLDPKSDLARRAQSADLREVQDAENKEWTNRYVEHLNFVVALRGGHDLSNIPVVMSFARGEWQRGSNLCGLIKMRAKTPLYGMHFAAQVGPRTNNKGDWMGIDCSFPMTGDPVGSFVPQEDYVALREAHLELRKALDAKLLQTDYDDDADDSPDPSRGEY